ncbi:MAG: hypothetical protein J0H29_12810 [Sphingobacteriales bacterium]|nr:hypothetical protein [Sphingobacteriales bacterium]
MYCFVAEAQTAAFERRISAMDSASYNNPREKLFIYIDKPYYRLRDTLWLKGYILTASDHAPNDSSKIAYIEIIDAAGTIVKRVNPPCGLGMFTRYIRFFTGAISPAILYPLYAQLWRFTFL